MLLLYFGYKAGQATMSGFWDQMKKLARNANPYRACFLQFVGVAENEGRGERLYREPADYFYNRCLHVRRGGPNHPVYSSEATKPSGWRRGAAGGCGAAATETCSGASP